jgi:energy-coupling factor transport system substrate-specific component
MSWQAVTFALLALVLTGGLTWYERSRPPARMVALVAALAALAVAGRLAFAPIPNVVATTDIVLFTGLALGAAPGFAVGALAALVSNIWLGQGPWTPWEMAGWGMVGVGGAALAPLMGRRPGRAGLAVACGLAGFAYGALLDLSVMVTYGGEQSLDRYLAISARGVPFNVAHAAGNVALALAAGPALVRMIARYRERFEFSWRPADRPSVAPGAVAGPLALLAAALVIAGPTPQAEAAGAATARSWLESAQNADGGFGASPGGSSSPAMTGWAMLGLEGAGRNPLDVSRHGRTPVDYLRANATRLRSTGDLERTVLALAGAGVSSRSVGGGSLVADLRSRRDADGSFEGQVNLTAFGILALRGAGEPARAVARSARWLLGARNGDGGWGFQPAAPSDPDSTGAALEGLAVAGVPRAVLRRGTTYLGRVQGGDGGFAISGGGASNSQSTAWAVQGLVAAGIDPARLVSRGRSPVDFLAARQSGDGHYRYSASSDQTPVWVTSQALLAVERRAFPLSAVPRASAPGGLAAPPAQPGGSAGEHGAGRPAGKPGAGASDQGREGGGAHGAGGGGAPRGGGHAGAGHRIRVGLVSATGSEGGPTQEAASQDDSLPTAAYVWGGLGLLAAALTAGFFLYRRRLPRPTESADE